MSYQKIAYGEYCDMGRLILVKEDSVEVTLNEAISCVTRGQFHQRVYMQLLRSQIPKAQKAA